MAPDQLEPLAWLLGEWRGEGRGSYPTIADFTYREEISFTRVRPDKPFILYTQRTRLLPDEAPSHSETGYVRPTAAGGVELVIAQPSGIVEVQEGAFVGGRLELDNVAIARTSTAKEVTEVRRVFERRGDDLWYQVDMAAVGQRLGFHLEATLQRAAA
jgi:hypothetical protein